MLAAGNASKGSCTTLTLRLCQQPLKQGWILAATESMEPRDPIAAADENFLWFVLEILCQV